MCDWCFMQRTTGADNGSFRVEHFSQSIEGTIPALRRYARALTRNAESADDLVQDTLVRALRSEHLFHGGDIRAWLFTILTNLNRNRLRSLARRPTLSPLEDDDAADLAGPEAGGRDIERALALLVEDQRMALVAGRAGRPVVSRSRPRCRAYRSEP